MDKKWREWAKGTFGSYQQEFDATLVLEDENFFIMDWRDKNGSRYLSIRYIVDKKKGNLIIKGDAGDCIASWLNPVSVEDLVHYINDTGYFMEKMQLATNKYTYYWEDVKEDLEDEKQKYLKMLRDGDITDMTEKELEKDFEQMSDILRDLSPLSEYCPYPEELIDITRKYTPDWWNGAFSRLGQRIDKRIYLWTYGFQEGVNRIRIRELDRKAISAHLWHVRLSIENRRKEEKTMNERNKPLTLKELKGMPGKPVYCPDVDGYGIVKCETKGQWAGIPFLIGAYHNNGVAVNFEYDIKKRKLKCYKIQQEMASERDIPKKPVNRERGYGDWCLVCPNCGQSAILNPFRKGHELYPHCPWCGQALKKEDRSKT